MGIAGDQSLWQDSKGRVFCFLHLPLLKAGHAVGVLFVLECCWLPHDLILPAPVGGGGEVGWGLPSRRRA